MTAQLLLQILNVIQGAFGWLAQRGLTKERVLALLDKAAAENRDVTTVEVQDELDLLQAELDETADIVKSLPE